MKNIKRLLALLMVFVLSFSLMACGSTSDEPKNTGEEQQEKKEEVELTVSAAISLQGALDKIAKDLEADENIKIVPIYDASGTLQKQIEEGGQSDVFISAGKKQVDALEEKDLIEKDSRIDLLKNKLVLVASEEQKDAVKSIDDVVNNNLKLAMGTPETVPAGQYAKDTLESLKLWDKIKDENKVFTKNVAEVRTHVANGDAAAGIIYKSDLVDGVMKGEKLTEVQVFADDLHKPIVYPAAIISASEKKDVAKTLLDYLQTDKAKAIFEEYGFVF